LTTNEFPHGITSDLHSKLNTTNAILPRAYGLPKIHKNGFPLRIIVSSIGSPLHNLATLLQKILKTSSVVPHSCWKNSNVLINKIQNIHIPDNYVLVSLDVTSLFTNVPIDKVLNIIDMKWPLIEHYTSIPKNEFLEATKFVLNSTYFKFNDKIYKQTYGAPMGSPLSPIVADLILQNLETLILGELTFTPPFYMRYVDDIAPHNSLDELLHKFNSFHTRLKFTMEVGDRELNFLEVKIINRDGGMIFDWYHKPTFSGRFLNFWSQHPITHKKGVICNLIDKVLNLSHPDFQQRNLTLMINILLDNSYPLELIFSLIKKRLHSRFHTNFHKHKNNSEDDDKKYFVMPYVGSSSEKIVQFFKNIPNVNVAFFGLNKLNSIIKAHKDILPTYAQSNVVYKISCLHCNATYVGQTRRLLKTRIEEHRSHIKRITNQSSVITEHRVKYGHDFDWNNVEILDKEPHYNKRLISEMIYIKKQTNSLNLQLDTERLNSIYFNII